MQKANNNNRNTKRSPAQKQVMTTATLELTIYFERMATLRFKPNLPGYTPMHWKVSGPREMAILAEMLLDDHKLLFNHNFSEVKPMIELIMEYV